ncbi:MAG: hypothetical protein R3A80_14015 [Bdellovibrionota bacterium]
MFSRFSISDYFVMPVFAENWLSLVAVLLALVLIKQFFYTTHKVSFISAPLIFIYSAILALPFQSLLALKLWKLSDWTVLNIVFPVSAFVTTLPIGFLLLKIHQRVNQWWIARKTIKAQAKLAA